MIPNLESAEVCVISWFYFLLKLVIVYRKQFIYDSVSDMDTNIYKNLYLRINLSEWHASGMKTNLAV